MRKRLAAALITIAVFVSTYGLFYIYFSLNERHTPTAVGDHLDLSDWHFEDHGVVPLDGEWEFYPDKLLSNEDSMSLSIQTGEPEAKWIEVPGTWSKHMKTLGMATYRLRVKIGDETQLYGLKTSSIQMSNRIMVNDRIIGSSGNPAEEQTYEAVNKPYVSYFYLQQGWNDIIVQAANYELPASSGINESIYLGQAAQISDLRDKALSHDWVTFATFLIMGLYFIGLYSQRKSDYFLIAFGMVSIFIALFSATRGERVLFSIFGPVPFWLFLRIQVVSALGAGMGFLLYVYTAFRSFCSVRFIRIGLIVGAFLTVMSLGFITHINTEMFRQLTSVYANFPLLYATYVFVLAAFHRVEGSLYLIVAAIALNVLALVQNLNVYFAVPIYSVAPFEPFLFLLMFALLMSQRFSNAFKKIEELSVQLLRADKLKDEFLARTSHEFKSPLHGVINISRSMLDDAIHPLTAEQQERVQLITSITGRLSQLVYDILDFSKLKQGELVIHPTPVDVRSAVEVHLRIYSFLSADRNIRLENRVPEYLPYAFVDESRFGQIIGNLLDNAVKHTMNGIIEVTALVNDGMIEISVQDTGEGMEAVDIPFIFEPFTSLDTTMVRRGFGLGLSIVKQLVQLQNGDIWVSSTKGAGTTFMFTLPIASRGSKSEIGYQAKGPSAKAPEYSFPTPYYLQQKGKHTVLIVDDHFSNLKILIDVLQPLGYNVIAVQNGYEAMEQINKANSVDLVILDLMMPGMSGYEVCQAIRGKYTLLELPVLMVTAAIQPQDKVAAFEAGANDFLTKPFDLAELKARIGSLLAMKESLSKAVDLEVAFLQSQIKPHFLYNVLNSIVASSYTDVERSRKLTTDLADYLRGSFRFSNVQKRVSFGQELSLIRSYVEIEQARFKDRIRIEYEIPEAIYGVSMPPLLLQPLVENAIHHGIGDRIEGGTVKLSAYETQGEYRFVIEDDGVGIESGRLAQLLHSKLDDRRGVGLLNINKRLKYEYGTELQLESEPGKGTKVIVRIPSAIA